MECGSRKINKTRKSANEIRAAEEATLKWSNPILCKWEQRKHEVFQACVSKQLFLPCCVAILWKP